MSSPQYVQRIVRVTKAFEVLAHHPNGLLVSDLASELSTTERELREEILAYYRADLTVDRLGGGMREPVIEFAAGPARHGDGWDDEDVDPAEAPYVRLRDLRAASDVGTKFFSLGQLARLDQAARSVLALEPDNDVLAGALDALDRSVLSGLGEREPARNSNIARFLREAVLTCRRVRIVYIRAWHPGVVERTIEPHRVVHTQRGWEVDAGVAGCPDVVRTYLVSGIREYEALDETFHRAANVEELVDANRREQPVVVVVPHAARWVVERFAESADLLDEDEELVVLQAHLLPPVARRLGLLLVVAGPDAFVREPAELLDAGQQMAQILLDHHRGT